MTAQNLQIEPLASSTSGEVKAFRLRPQDVERLAPLLAVAIGRAVRLTTGRTTPKKIIRQGARAEVQFWVAMRAETEILAVVITELIDYPTGKKALRILLAEGQEMRIWTPWFGEIEAEAKDQGCSVIEYHGRPGWSHIFPEFRELYRAYEKEI